MLESKNNSTCSSKTFISSDRLKNIFTYRTKLGKIKYHTYAIYLFIDIHKKIKSSKYSSEKIKITYKEIQNKFKISKSTVMRILNYLSNEINVINRVTYKIKKNVNNKIIFHNTELYISILYDNLEKLFRIKNERYNFITNSNSTNNSQFSNVQKCTQYNNSNILNRSISSSVYKKKETDKKTFIFNKFQTLDKFLSSKDILIKLQEAIFNDIKTLVDVYQIKEKINYIINKSTIQPKFYSPNEFIKYMTKVIKNHIDVCFWEDKKNLYQIELNQELLDQISVNLNKRYSLNSTKNIIKNIIKSGKNPTFKSKYNFIKYMSLVLSNEKFSEDELNDECKNTNTINKVKNTQAINDNEILVKRLFLKLNQYDFTRITEKFYFNINKNDRICTLTIKQQTNTNEILNLDIKTLLKHVLMECFHIDFYIQIKQKDFTISIYDNLINNLLFTDITKYVVNTLKQTMGMYDKYTSNFDTWFNESKILINKYKQNEIKIISNNSFSSKYLSKNFNQHIMDAIIESDFYKHKYSTCTSYKNVKCEFIVNENILISGQCVKSEL